MPAPATNTQSGYSLLELVMGIIVFAIVLTLITSLIVPQARRSVDPILQLRAAELAQSIIREISARSFDENSDRINGFIRCNEDLNGDSLVDDSVPGAEAERACSAVFVAEEANRSLYDDVDDYHGLSQSGGNIVNSLNQPIVVDGLNLYAGYQVTVNVTYAGDFYDAGQPISNAKLVTVTVITPTNQQLVFSTYRSNF